jgi:hypothetical protein
MFDCEGLDGEIYWHFSDIEKSLLKKGALPTEYVGEPLPKIKLSWRQSKQGKGRNKAEKKMQPQRSGWFSTEWMPGVHGRARQKRLETPGRSVEKVQ